MIEIAILLALLTMMIADILEQRRIRNIETRVNRMSTLIEIALGSDAITEIAGNIEHAWRCPSCQKVNTTEADYCVWCGAYVDR